MASGLGLVDAEASQKLTEASEPKPEVFCEHEGKGESSKVATEAVNVQQGKGGKKNKSNIKDQEMVFKPAVLVKKGKGGNTEKKKEEQVDKKKEEELDKLLESVLAQI